MKSVYLDYAAATPLDHDVLVSMAPYSTVHFHNPSALYAAAARAKRYVEEARGEIAQSLGVKSAEIVFTAGGTEANNLAIFGVAGRFKKSSIILSAIEHDSITEPALALQKKGHNISYLPVSKSGIVEVDHLDKLIRDDTVLVSVMLANNEVGTIQPIREIAQIIEKKRAERIRVQNTLPLLLHSDACQALNYIDVNPHRLGVDLMTLSASKIYGPKQCALLYIKAGVVINPLILGGGQEMNLRSGTESVANICGFKEALLKTISLRKDESSRLKKIQQSTIQKLQAIPNLEINGSIKQRLPNNLHFSIAGHDNERLVYLLDEHGYMVATGSACSAASTEPSRVLRAMGKQDTAPHSLRISLGRQTTQTDMDGFVKVLKTLVS